MLFSDETGFCLHPKLSRVWAKKGKQPYVLARSQHRDRLNVFGWVDPVEGGHGMIRQEKGNTSGSLSMLGEILRRYKTRIELWVDHAGWHKGGRVSQFLMEHTRLTISYIPKYHPELNLQEPLWRTMRYEETTNTYYETLQELDVAVLQRSQRSKPSKILSLCHVT